MPTLQNLDGRSLVPSNEQAIENLLGTIVSERDRQQEIDISEAKLKATKRLLPSIALGEEGAGEALIRLAAINPQAANAIRPIVENRDAKKLLQLEQEKEQGLRDAFFIQQGKTRADRMARARKVAERKSLKNEPLDNIVAFAKKNDDEQKVALDNMIATGLTIEAITKRLAPQEEFETVTEGGRTFQRSTTSGQEIASPRQAPDTRSQEIKDLDEAVRRGAITPQQRQDAIVANVLEPAEGQDRIPASEVVDGFILTPQPDGSIKKTRVFSDAEREEIGLKPQSSKIFQNGATLQVASNGETIVQDKDGNVVTGDDRVRVLKEANDFEFESAGVKAGTRAAAKASIKRSEAFIDKLEGVNKSIANIDRGIAALDDGAQTGALKSFFPSIRTSSIELDNVQKNMGLDVISNTTFGALSEGELRLALSAAVPTRLKPKALRAWLVEKKAAQTKLADYLRNAALFLGVPGRTTAQWIEAQQAIQESGKGDEAPAAQETQPTTQPAQPSEQPAGLEVGTRGKIGDFTFEVIK